MAKSDLRVEITADFRQLLRAFDVVIEELEGTRDRLNARLAYFVHLDAEPSTDAEPNAGGG